ncbi:hypothetical protein I553_3896 [Mycobacterium xenopi 4042]|uniref:Uncharacterized protein n=1 Tax=Mycobacterium xenopi 4042 TaxID=1299334 RepID=X8DBY6_MYCXE|nr:hypothetical protein I553_3896 [Mycobacterium xenopi 4042]
MNGCCMTAAKPRAGLRESWVAEFTERRRVVAVHPSSHRCELVPGHNMSLVTAYLQHEHLASRGPRGTLLHQSRAGPCSLHPRAGCRAATGARLACPAGRLLGDRGWVSPASSSRSRGCCPTAIPWVSTSHRSSRRNTVSGTWPLLPRLVTLRVSLLLMRRPSRPG